MVSLKSSNEGHGKREKIIKNKLTIFSNNLSVCVLISRFKVDTHTHTLMINIQFVAVFHFIMKYKNVINNRDDSDCHWLKIRFFFKK